MERIPWAYIEAARFVGIACLAGAGLILLVQGLRRPNEDAVLLAHWTDGPGARPTAADQRRWLEAAERLPRLRRQP